MDDDMDDNQDDDDALPVPGRRRGGRFSASVGDDEGDADADDNDDDQADNDDDNQLMGTVRGGGDTREGRFRGMRRGRIVICWSFFASQKIIPTTTSAASRAIKIQQSIPHAPWE